MYQCILVVGATLRIVNRNTITVHSGDPQRHGVVQGATTANFAAGVATPRGRFFVIVGVFFGPAGTPETSQDTRAPPEPPGSIFHRFLDVPGRAFGGFGGTVSFLWLPSVALLRTEGDQKREKRHSGTLPCLHGSLRSENKRPRDV